MTISYTTVRDTSGYCSYTSLIVKCRFSRMMRFTLQCVCDDRGSPWSLSVMNICSPIPEHFSPFSDTGRVNNMFAIDCNKSSVNFTGSNVFRLQNPDHASHRTVGGIWYRRVHCHNPLHSQREKSSLHQLHQVTIYTLLNTPNDWSGTMKQLRGLYAQTFFTFRTAVMCVCVCVCVCVYIWRLYKYRFFKVLLSPISRWL